MRFTKATFFTSLIATAALLTCGAAGAQQASFAVAVTLHAAAKPMSAAKLCPAGKPAEILGATIRVDCPLVANAGTHSTAERTGSSLTNAQRHPEVTVTF